VTAGAGGTFFPPDEGAPGGRGWASALAIGRGEAVAEARARAGAGTPGGSEPSHPGAVASALAKAIGASGSATSRARSSSGNLQVQASAQASVLRAATAEARVGPAGQSGAAGDGLRRLTHYLSGRDASVQATVAPGEHAVETALRRERELRQALDDAGVDRVEALGTFSAWQRQRVPGSAGGSAQVISALELALSPFLIGLGRGTDPVFIGLFAPQLSRNGFVQLRVTLENVDDLLLDATFDDAVAAQAFLSGTLLEVGEIESGIGNPSPIPIPPLPPSATLRIEVVTRRPGAGLALDFLVGSVSPTP
jgi:hypothetical protein